MACVIFIPKGGINMSTQTINEAQLEKLISKIISQVIPQKEKQSINRNEIEAPEEITTMTQVRSRIYRLDILFPNYNFDSIWRDRVTAIIGKSVGEIRLELQEYYVKCKVDKYAVSFYDAISRGYSEKGTYLDIGIQVIRQLEKEYNIQKTIYKYGEMTKKQQDEFCEAKVIHLNNKEFQAWYERRLDDFAKMCNVKKFASKEDVIYLYRRGSGEALYKMALCRGYEDYNSRLYKDSFHKCVQEFGCGRVGEDISKIYNCKGLTPLTKESRERIREYMVKIARDCLII